MRKLIILLILLLVPVFSWAEEALCYHLENAPCPKIDGNWVLDCTDPCEEWCNNQYGCTTDGIEDPIIEFPNNKMTCDCFCRCKNKCTSKPNHECKINQPVGKEEKSLDGCIPPQKCWGPPETQVASEFSTISVLVIIALIIVSFILIRKK